MFILYVKVYFKNFYTNNKLFFKNFTDKQKISSKSNAPKFYQVKIQPGP